MHFTKRTAFTLGALLIVAFWFAFALPGLRSYWGPSLARWYDLREAKRRNWRVSETVVFPSPEVEQQIRQREVELTKQVKVKPTYELAAELGIARAQLGDLLGSREAYRLAVRIDQENGYGWLNLGRTMLNMWDRTGAEQAFLRSVAVLPGEEQGWIELMNLYGNRFPDKVDLVFPTYEKARRVLVTHGNIDRWYANFLEVQTGNLAGAKAIWEGILRDNPNDEVAKAEIKRLKTELPADTVIRR